MDYFEKHGQKVPKLGLGTARMKGPECKTAVKKALKRGYRHIDTAQMYENEEDIGRAIKMSDIERDQVFITTKILPENLEHEKVLETTDNSLKRLKTDYIDLLLIHAPSSKVPVEETLGAMEKLVEQGKVENIGVSNFSKKQMEEASEKSRQPLMTNQVKYNPFKPQEELISACRKQNISLTAHTPLERGKVANNKTIKDISSFYNKTPYQVVLKWLVEQENVLAIPKASSREHMEQNISIFDFELEEKHVESIGNASPGLIFKTTRKMRKALRRI